MADTLVITGATATGKTSVAMEVAQRIGGEIISLDSRQIYRGMNIGTAKATPEQQAVVKHYGIDLLAPSERYNAGSFAQHASEWLEQIRDHGHLPIFVGGTGFFLRALTHPLFEEPELDPARKEAMKQYLNAFSREELLRWLAALDPGGAKRLSSEAGRQRLGRMIEVVLLTGRSLTWWQQHAVTTGPLIKPHTFVLELPRRVLYDRINARVIEMVNNGLVQEVTQLMDRGYTENSPGMKTTGYTELMPYIRGEVTLEEAIDAIQRATRSYARRQETWFRHQLFEPVVRLDATLPVAEIADRIVSEWPTTNENRH